MKLTAEQIEELRAQVRYMRAMPSACRQRGNDRLLDKLLDDYSPASAETPAQAKEAAVHCADPFLLGAERLLRSIMQHRESYVRAWYAATGTDPRDAVLVQQDLGNGCMSVVVMTREDFRRDYPTSSGGG